jgi:transposase
VIDLLADRTSASLEAWLAARPAAPTVVTRDRSGVYAKAITAAAPDAVQVADRWHLLANCREALVRVLDRHHSPIAEAMVAAQSQTSGPDIAQDVAPSAANPLPTADLPAVPSPPLDPVPLSRNQQQSIDRRAKRVARYEQVLELDRQGHSQRAIVRQLKMSRTQVLKLLNADGFPERAKTHHAKQVDRYVDQLRARWEAGVRNARELTRHIRTLGYTGGSDMVRRCVASWRTPAERLRLCGSKPRPRSPVPLKLQRPSSDRLSWLLVKDDLERRTGESALLDELRKHCEPIRVASELARSFGQAVRGRDINVLTAWTERALQTTSTKEMNGLADSLIRNWPEVRAAVEMPWSNGRTEGHVNRLKLIKRKMYGRAKLDLLRIRVLGSGP